jgi:uncharacterized membrane protein YfcA
VTHLGESIRREWIVREFGPVVNDRCTKSGKCSSLLFMADYILLLVAGLVAGAMNAAAGGGSFVTLPAMIFAGVPSVEANASSTVALFPGAMASVLAYRDDFKPFEFLSLRVMLAVSMVGGLFGALLLLLTPAKRFDVIVPWLLLAGTLVFAFGARAGVWLRRVIRIGPLPVLCCQFLLGIYCGYFGGAVGIMTLAVWSLLGMTDIRAMNASKTLVVGATNAVAVACFVVASKVWWPQTSVMLVAAILGGYGGARFARRVPPQRLRLGISAFNFVITAVFFWRAAP